MPIGIKNKIIVHLSRFFSPKLSHNYIVKKTAESYDMYKNTDEEFYSKIYLKYILDALPKERGNLQILDAGCGQGRISISLAKEGHKIDAVDVTKTSVIKLKEYAKDTLRNISLFQEDIGSFLKKTATESYDSAICTEVTFMLPNYDEVIKELVRVLRKNGLLILSVKPKLVYALDNIIKRDFQKTSFVVSKRDGNSLNWFFNWYTKEELIEKLSFLRISDIKCYGIGVVSGLQGDPQGLFLRPSLLNERQKEELFAIELNLAPLFPDSGRYILAIGVKK